MKNKKYYEYFFIPFSNPLKRGLLTSAHLPTHPPIDLISKKHLYEWYLLDYNILYLYAEIVKHFVSKKGIRALLVLSDRNLTSVCVVYFDQRLGAAHSKRTILTIK